MGVIVKDDGHCEVRQIRMEDCRGLNGTQGLFSRKWARIYNIRWKNTLVLCPL